MDNSSLIEKLSLQAESFQDGFEVLSKSTSLVEMVKNFMHIIRGNLIITEIYAFHKIETLPEWKNISLKKIPDNSYLNYLQDSVKPLIEYFNNQKIEVSITLPLQDHSYLGILIGHKLDKSPFTDLDKITLQILLQVFDSAYKSYLNRKKEKALIFELNEKVLHLNGLIDSGIEISRYSLGRTRFNIALERISSLTNASSGLIEITDKTQNNSKSYITFPDGINPEKILSSKFRIQSSFEHHNHIYTFVLSEKETRHNTTAFKELDQLLLDAIAQQVSVSLENEYLHKQSLEKEIIEKEINVAASIQKRILPDSLPAISGYELAGINIPSREVGGDYYDCIDLGNRKFALIIADVAGKGIGAALLVSTLNAALYSYLQFDIPLTDICDRLNKLIYKSSPSDKYITFFIAVLNPNSGDLDIVNAGHNPIFLLKKDGSVEKLDVGGVGLGMFDFGIPFVGQKTRINSGDKLFLYTDGIPEAMNENEDEYSDEKMLKFVIGHSDKTSEEFINELVNDVKAHVGSAPQSDDITALILKRL